MPLIEIWADSKGIGRCKSCDKKIEWAEVVRSGRKFPFDAPIVAVKTSAKDGRQVETVDTDVTAPHFQTCPNADAHRRKK